MSLASPLDKARLGVITPLYVSPQQNLPAWIMLASVARRYPRIHNIAVVDVRRGPGLGPDPMYQANISMLKENGVTILGYIESDEGKDVLKHDMKNWRNWYPEIDGFYFGHVARDDDVTPFYEDLVKYAKDYLECKFVAAEFSKENRPVLPQRLVLNAGIDLFVSYRDRNVPAPIDSLRGGISEDYYPAHRFGIILTKLPTTPHSQRMCENFIRQAITHNIARYFYFHTDDGAREMHPDPFTRISEFLEVTVQDLDRIAASEKILPAPPAPASPTEYYVRNDEVTATTDPSTGAIIVGNRKLVSSHNVSEDLPTSSTAYDKFGIKKIYPDAAPSTFQEWYFKQDQDVTKDPRLTNWKNANLRRMQDGSKDTWYVNGKAARGQVRLQAKSESPSKRWLNNEHTIFFKYLRDLSGTETGAYAAQLYTRSGWHSTTEEKGQCQGACYKAAVYKKDGRTTLRKEVAHPLYCPNRATQPGVTAHGVKGKWVGFKHIVYNVQENENEDVMVVMETYILQNCTGRNGELVIPPMQDWKLTSRFIDRGYWGLENSSNEKKLQAEKCNSLQIERKGQPRKSTDVISRAGGNDKDGNFSVFRCDGVEMVITNWSCREIKAEQID